MTSASDFGMSVPMRKTLLLVLLASGCGGASTPATTPVDEAQASSERRIDPLLVALDGGGEVLVSAAHIDDVRVESCSHAQPQETLSIASPLRRWRAEQIPCAVATTSAAGGVRTVVGRLDLVAEDYVEITESSGRDSARSPVGAPGGGLLVPIPAIAYVRPEKRML